MDARPASPSLAPSVAALFGSPPSPKNRLGLSWSTPQNSRYDTEEPFGFELYPGTAQAAAGNNRIGFTGHETDERRDGWDSVYAHYRHYAQSAGRFMRPDNISGSATNPQSWNLYSYVRGNPVNFNDPTGHAPMSGRTSRDGATGQAYVYGSGWDDAPGYMYNDDAGPGISGGGGAGSGDGSSSGNAPINVKVPIYMDKAMELTQEQAEQEYSRITNELTGTTAKSFGKIGINISFFPGGNADLSIHPSGSGNKVTVTPASDAFQYQSGSLMVVRTNNIAAGGVYAKSQFHLLADGKTGVIYMRPGTTANVVRHEFLHAFGLTSKNWLGALGIVAAHFGPLWFEERLLMLRSTYRQNAASYAAAQ